MKDSPCLRETKRMTLLINRRVVVKRKEIAEMRFNLKARRYSRWGLDCDAISCRSNHRNASLLHT